MVRLASSGLVESEGKAAAVSSLVRRCSPCALSVWRASCGCVVSGVESVLFFQFVEETVAVDDVAHVRALADDSVTVFGLVTFL